MKERTKQFDEPHLREQEICGWIVGDRPLEVLRHVNECAACRTTLEREIEQTGAALSGFQAVARNAAADAEWRRPALMMQRSAGLGRSGRLKLALAGAVLAIAFFGMRMVRMAPSAGPAVTVQADVDDAQLMDRVYGQMHRTVPSSMAPIAELLQQTDTVTSSGSEAQAKPEGKLL